jgi:uncharacterized damage-inducible protein DinB
MSSALITDTASTTAAPIDTAPTDTAPTDTAPTDTAPTDTAPTDTAPTATQERADLVESLTTRRQFLRQTVRDMTDQQASLRPTASQLCLGGIIKHVAMVEERWVDFILEGPAAMGPTDEAAYQAHAASFRMDEGETLAGLLAEYEQVAGRTDRLVHTLPSLDASHPLPEAPWFEPGASRTARQVLVHIVAETAQHAGHADIIRESIDGAKTMG